MKRYRELLKRGDYEYGWRDPNPLHPVMLAGVESEKFVIARISGKTRVVPRESVEFIRDGSKHWILHVAKVGGEFKWFPYYELEEIARGEKTQE